MSFCQMIIKYLNAIFNKCNLLVAYFQNMPFSNTKRNGKYWIGAIFQFFPLLLAKKEKVMGERTVIHLQLLESNEHYYFGSLKALCARFGKEVIGISYSSLRNRPPQPGAPYRNKYCIIRKGVLEAIPTQRGPRPIENGDEDAKE